MPDERLEGDFFFVLLLVPVTMLSLAYRHMLAVILTTVSHIIRPHYVHRARTVFIVYTAKTVVYTTSTGCLLIIIISLNENEQMHPKRKVEKKKQRNNIKKNWIAKETKKIVDLMPDSWGLGGMKVREESEKTTTFLNQIN